MPSTQVFRHSSGIAIVESLDEARVAVLRLDSPQPYVLTGSAAMIWDFVDGENDTDGIAAEILAHFPDGNSNLPEIVHDFLQSLHELQLLELVPHANHQETLQPQIGLPKVQRADDS